MFGLLCTVVRTVIQFFCRFFYKTICRIMKLKKKSFNSAHMSEIGNVSDTDKQSELDAWSSWDEGPNMGGPETKPVDPIQQKIDEYRERKMVLQTKTDVEDGIDFFEGMTPKITKQPLVLVQGVEAKEGVLETCPSLAVDPNFCLPELGVWEESGNWEEPSTDGWTTFEILREKRIVERISRTPNQKDPQAKRTIGTKVP